MDRRLLLEWIQNPALLEGVTGQDLENLLAAHPSFEAAKILQLVHSKQHHSTEFSRTFARQASTMNQGRWLYRALNSEQPESKGSQGQMPAYEGPGQEPANEGPGQMPANEVQGQMPANEGPGQMPANEGPGQMPANEVQGQESANEVQGQEPPMSRLEWFVTLGRVEESDPADDELEILYQEYAQSDLLDAPTEHPDTQALASVALRPASEMERIRQLASLSLNTEEVPISESLAELYLEQGQKAMAQQIYRRLMLRFPAKVSYFAARLDRIQNT
jgi:hypothetical protein